MPSERGRGIDPAHRFWLVLRPMKTNLFLALVIVLVAVPALSPASETLESKYIRALEENQQCLAQNRRLSEELSSPERVVSAAVFRGQDKAVAKTNCMNLLQEQCSELNGRIRGYKTGVGKETYMVVCGAYCAPY
jgi:hypothetical protein